MATGRRKLQQTPMEMDEDLILEIAARLPLKFAVQCTLLNKNIRRWIISQPNFLPHYSTIFYSSKSEPKIFTSIWQAIRSRTVHPLRRSVTLEKGVTIKASCNGLLFIQMHEPVEYFIFNPATAAIVSLTHDIAIQRYPGLGLAAADSGLLKLVGLSYGRGRISFRVFVPREGNMVIKSSIFCLGRKLDKLLEEPVYADGNLYWLAKREEGKITVVFDVEGEKARLIEGLVDADKWWFGAAEGSVYFVYSSEASEIVICRLDGEEWRVARRVSNSKAMKNGEEEPLFYDGRRWLFVWRRSGGGGGGNVYRYDLVMDLWERIERLGCKPRLFSYASTFAKISTSTYNGEIPKGAVFGVNSTYNKVQEVEGETPRNALLGLQKLLTVM